MIDVALIIHTLTDRDSVRWDDFVNSCSEATFFHRAGWKEIMERAFGHRTFFLYAESNGEIQGVLPLAEVKSWLFGHSLCSLPFCVYGGIAANSEAAREKLDLAAQELANKLHVDHLEYRSFKATHPGWANKDLYVTFRKQIYSDPKENMLVIPRKQRAMVRKGVKAGLRSEIDHNVDRFYALFSDNVHRHGTPALSKQYFRLLTEVFGDDCEVLTVVDQSNRSLSSVLTFYFRKEVLPYYAGDDVAGRALAANDFKYWDLMRRATERGCKLFDFGRSKIGTGPYQFKRNWGFEPTPLNYEYQLHSGKTVPDKNPLNPKYRLFIKVWQTMPLAVANRLGPYLVKYLG
ncbi:MAG: FemAB family PEP-CTERM system-associated protein [Pseudomonadota bacterium]|nr:FemAB family PEP-CTERM system-associated protein [Pseudomonadota bacterium]